MIPPIRVAAKAVVIDGEEILLTRNLHPNDPDGEFYLLPGGGQHYGESLSECIRREVLEETGYDVSVGEVVFVRDYIGANHEFAAYEPDVHQVEQLTAQREPKALSIPVVAHTDVGGEALLVVLYGFKSDLLALAQKAKHASFERSGS